MSIDLHTHSMASDGTMSSSGLVESAIAAGLKAIALTDHDTVSGLAEFLSAARGKDIIAVPGVEISTMYFNKEVHIVGLFIDKDSKPLNGLLEDMRRSRSDRNSAILMKLNSLGYPLTMDEVLENADGESVGRPHIASALVKKGLFPAIQDVFDKLIRRGMPAYVQRRFVPPPDVIRIIHEAGGLAVWAHPLGSQRNERSFAKKTLRHFAGFGLDAIEAYYTSFSPEQTQFVLELAKEFSILPSGGSDYHGTNHPGVEMGVGTGSLNVPDSVYDALVQRKEKQCIK